MGEVEAQTIGIDDAAGLFDVRAEHFAESGVEQMRGGVIAHRWTRADAPSTLADEPSPA